MGWFTIDDVEVSLGNISVSKEFQLLNWPKDVTGGKGAVIPMVEDTFVKKLKDLPEDFIVSVNHSSKELSVSKQEYNEKVDVSVGIAGTIALSLDNESVPPVETGYDVAGTLTVDSDKADDKIWLAKKFGRAKKIKEKNTLLTFEDRVFRQTAKLGLELEDRDVDGGLKQQVGAKYLGVVLLYYLDCLPEDEGKSFLNSVHSQVVDSM